ncbi:MAG: homocysteine S-methyltransferase [Woeseia sp.]
MHARSNLFEAALYRNSPVVLDGGLATELESQGFDIGTQLWSAALLQSDPSAVIDAHRAYLDAGAEIIISASYQASRDGFMSQGLSVQQADDLIANSVDLACKARQQFIDTHGQVDYTPIVAASIGPYGAAVHDGSEYTGDYDIDEAGLRRFHEPRLQLLDRSNADVLACETVAGYPEARVLCKLLMTTRLPAWISFSCRDERRIGDGTLLREASGLFHEHPRVLALGVNCTAPQYVSSLIGEIIKGAPDKAVIVYPNSGEKYDIATNSWIGRASSVDLVAAAKSWHDAGAKIIGGCCRIGPRHIDALRQRLK